MMSISILPRLILSPVAGVFGDWFDRKKSIVRLDFINGLLLCIYALYFSISGELSLISVYVLVILLEIIEVFFSSAMAAAIPSIVKNEELFLANSVKSVITNFCSIAAPILASLLYGFVGLQIILVISGISFILSALSELTIEIPATHKKPEKINLVAFKTDLGDSLNQVTNGVLKDSSVPGETKNIFISYFNSYTIQIYSVLKPNFVAWGFMLEKFFEQLIEQNENELLERILLFKNLGDKTRYEVLKCVAKGITSTKIIAEQLGVSSATISYHLSNLATCKLITLLRQEGRYHYVVNHDLIDQCFTDLKKDLLF